MDPHFPDWCATSGVEWKADELAMRWQAVEAAATGVTPLLALELSRLVCGLTPKDTANIEGYYTALQGKDPSIRSNAPHERELLAGATLAVVLSSSKAEAASTGALALVCADFGGRRPGERRRAFVDRARQFLVVRGEALRRRPPLTAGTLVKTIPAQSDKIGKAITDAEAANNVQQTAQALQGAWTYLVSQIQGFAKPVADQIDMLARIQRLQDEESQMLWWVFGEHSRTQGPVRALGPHAACLVAARDLGDLTTSIPGPVAAPALLDKMLQSASPSEPLSDTSVFMAVNATSNAWRADTAKSFESGLSRVLDLCPVTTAIAKSLEVASDADWVPVFEHLTGLRAHDPLPRLELAVQSYSEHLLLTAASRLTL